MSPTSLLRAAVIVLLLGGCDPRALPSAGPIDAAGDARPSPPDRPADAAPDADDTPRLLALCRETCAVKSRLPCQDRDLDECEDDCDDDLRFPQLFPCGRESILLGGCLARKDGGFTCEQNDLRYHTELCPEQAHDLECCHYHPRPAGQPPKLPDGGVRDAAPPPVCPGR
jgi:hypothetical protein